MHVTDGLIYMLNNIYTNILHVTEKLMYIIK